MPGLAGTTAGLLASQSGRECIHTVLSYCTIFVIICYKSNRRRTQAGWVWKGLVGNWTHGSDAQEGGRAWWLTLENRQCELGTGSSEAGRKHMDGNVKCREGFPKQNPRGTPACKNGQPARKLMGHPLMRRVMRRVRGQGEQREANDLTRGIWLLVSDAKEHNYQI